MSHAGRGTGDTVGSKTVITGKAPWNWSLTLELVLQVWESKRSFQCHGNTITQEATLTIACHTGSLWVPDVHFLMHTEDGGSLDAVGVVHGTFV